MTRPILAVSERRGDIVIIDAESRRTLSRSPFGDLAEAERFVAWLAPHQGAYAADPRIRDDEERAWQTERDWARCVTPLCNHHAHPRALLCSDCDLDAQRDEELAALDLVERAHGQMASGHQAARDAVAAMNRGEP